MSSTKKQEPDPAILHFQSFLEAILDGSLNSLETFLTEITPSPIPTCIFERVFELCSSLRKKVILLIIFLEKRGTKIYDSQAKQLFLEEFGVSNEVFSSGINLYTTEFMFVIIKCRILDEAVRTWPHFNENKNIMTKKMMVFCRKMQVLIDDIGLAMEAPKDDVINTPKKSSEWMELKKITTIYNAGNPLIMRAAFDEYNHIVRVGQAAHAKLCGTLLDVETLTPKEIKEHLEFGFLEYEKRMNELQPDRFKVEWKKGYVPSFGSSLFKMLFKYMMMNKEESYADIEFYASYCNHHSVKDYWNMSETYVAKASRNFKMRKVPVSKVLYIPVGYLDPKMKEVEGKEGKPYVRRLIDRISPVSFTDEQIVPPDLLFDDPDKERIGIRLICSLGIPLKELIKNFADEKKIEILLKKPVPAPTPRKSKVDEEAVKEAAKKTKEEEDASEIEKEEKKISDYVEHRRIANIGDILENIKIDEKDSEGSKSDRDNGEKYIYGDVDMLEASVLEGEEEEPEEEKPKETEEEKQKRLDREWKPESLEEQVVFEELDYDLDAINEAIREPTKHEKILAEMNTMFKNIIVHIHGGGFIAMSSGHHQPYSRLFCTETNTPVFSIDYRLAPLAKYPENIHDCVNAYFWILEFCKKVIGVEPEKIVLVGDSAGGSLCYSLLYWLIENN